MSEMTETTPLHDPAADLTPTQNRGVALTARQAARGSGLSDYLWWHYTVGFEWAARGRLAGISNAPKTVWDTVQNGATVDEYDGPQPFQAFLAGWGAGTAYEDLSPSGATADGRSYAQRETEVNRLAQIIVNAGCKPYTAAQALLAAGVRLPGSSSESADDVPTRFRHFGGYYRAKLNGVEVARFAPSNHWSDYATMMERDVPDFSYDWVTTDGTDIAGAASADQPAETTETDEQETTR